MIANGDKTSSSRPDDRHHTCQECDFIIYRKTTTDENYCKCSLSGNHVNPAMVACALFTLPELNPIVSYRKEQVEQ